MKKKVKKLKSKEDVIRDGNLLLKQHYLFQYLSSWYLRTMNNKDLHNYAFTRKGYEKFELNKNCDLTEKQWAYVIAHCLLHHYLGHYNLKKFNLRNVDFKIWNQACDIYITKFLADLKLGGSIFNQDIYSFPIPIKNEVEIYEYLLNHLEIREYWNLSTSVGNDMKDFDVHYTNEKDIYQRTQNDFARALRYAVECSINSKSYRFIDDIVSWFISKYPLFGAVASSFEIIEKDYSDIKIAAVNPSVGKIYINSNADLNDEEWKFVLAHEYLHAGLNHDTRQKGRDGYLWNVACDYVINDWLLEMKIGEMPKLGLLYDETLHGMSAEEIYDMMVKDLKKYAKLTTFYGLEKSDIIYGNPSKNNSVDLNEFYRDALKQGMDFHQKSGRGYLPAGLIEEIMSLSMPAIPWEIQLATWLDEYIPDETKKRTYSRLSRRQASTPDIIRPGTIREHTSYTFGAIIDTSGSMSTEDIGKALGSIVSYAISKDVTSIRIIYCDAKAYDAGYLRPEEIAGNVEVKGRGGTVIQPAVDLLEKADDFPKDAPILIITDGEIENQLHLHYPHAFLIPQGAKLPFKTKGKLFYM